MPDRINSWVPRLFFVVLSLIIMGPILRPGYIFTLDFVGGPIHYLEINNLASSVLTYLLIWLSSLVAAFWFVQKVAFFLVICVAGLSMYHCVPVKNVAARYFAGFLYVVNPFVFSRLEAGHIGLLAAYACLPFALRSVFRFFDSPSSKAAVLAGAWIGFLSLLSLHAVMAWIPFAAALFVHLLAHSGPHRKTMELLKGTGVAALVFILVSLCWIIPMMTGAGSIAGISASQATEFATRADVFYGLLPNVAAMQGFWQSQLAEPKMFGAVWIVPFLAILALSVFGLFTANGKENTRYAAIAVGISGLIGIVLALGVSSPATAWLYRLLYDFLPGFRGFREPQKFIALAAFAYAYLGAFGLGRMLEGRTEAAKAAGMLAAGLAFILVGFYTFPIFWGLSGNVRVASYPDGWQRAERVMSADSSKGRILFLPWHLYMPFDFVNPAVPIASPANRFFTREVLSGKNIELNQTYSTSGDPEQKKAQSIIKKGAQGVSVASALRSMNIRFVVLAKDSNWRAYKWLYANCGLYPVVDNADIAVFKTGR